MTTIFYTNSFGIIAQWKGDVIAFDENSISIRFSKNKALRYNLKNTDFVLITNKYVKTNMLQNSEVLSFDSKLTQHLIESLKDNTQMLWNGKEWTNS